MESTYDVYISFFRDLEIRTAGSTLTEQIINAPKTIQLIAYRSAAAYIFAVLATCSF